MIPKLRFPEFNDSWNKIEVDSLGEIKGGGTPSKQIESYWNGTIYWISSSDLMEESIWEIKTHRFISKEALINSATKLIPEGSILIVTRVGLGKVALSDKPLCTSQDFSNLILKPNYSKPFIAYVVKNLMLKLSLVNQGTSIKGVTTKTLKSAEVIIPSFSEQQRIEQVLKSVDQKINLLTKKKEALETYKKGLMQKIFSQEFSNQRLMLLSQICKIYDGTHQTPKYVDEGVPFYSVEHVSKDDFSKTKFITEEVFTKECKRVSIEQGDILMTRIGSVGVPKFIDWDVRASFYVSLALLKPKIEEINMEWLSYYIQSLDIQRDIWRLTIHVAFPKKINLGDIGKIKIKLPSKAVQESNYVLLKSLDQNINLTIKKIKASEELKKGLLQQMFV